MRWQTAITTVPQRSESHFPRTIGSLRSAGFPKPQVFVDGRATVDYAEEWGLTYTERPEPLGVVGNWITTLWTIYLQNPKADRYAIFQDDIVLCKNVRQYLEQIDYPEDGYLNLFTFRKDVEKTITKENYATFYKSPQYGRGAVALVFNRDAVVSLLSAKSLALKPQHASRGNTIIDGAIVTALSPKYKQQRSHFEYVHNPSLVYHTGDVSTIKHHNQAKALTFPGEDFDCLSLLE